MNEKTQIQKIETALGMKIANFAEYSDGFSFTVATELEAYKAAYAYQGCGRVSVREAKSVEGWLVQLIVR